MVENPDETLTHRPSHCSGCGTDLAGLVDDGDPFVHQVSELLEVLVRVVEHRRLRVSCPGCGRHTLAALPVGVSDGAFGPRMEATIATLAGVYRLSRDQARQLVVEIFKAHASN